MRITFYANHPYWGGLANNGGTRTILRSAEVLRAIGHKVDVVANSDKFTWFEHPKPISMIPKKADAVIAVSVSDVAQLYYKEKRQSFFYWARPFELWQMNSDDIYGLLNRIGKDCKVLCNSAWQVRTLALNGINATIQYSGLDLEFWKSVVTHNVGTKKIGSIYNTKERKNWKEFVRAANILGDKYRYVAFGSEECKDEFISEYLQNPSPEQLRDLYSGCDFWFAPTKLEGFHNVAAEANLCGCLVVCNNIFCNGMNDYAGHDTAVIYDSIDGIVPLIVDEDLNKSRIIKMNDVLVNKIGDRKTNMENLVELLKNS